METYSGNEEENLPSYALKPSSDKGPVCNCSIPCTCVDLLVNSIPTPPPEKSARTEHLLGAVSRTENYLRERRIPELVRFLMSKILANGCDSPVAYLSKVLDECMLSRAGYGQVPVLYEERFVNFWNYINSVIISFDKGFLTFNSVTRR